MGDLVWEEYFSQTSGISFSALYAMSSDIFFSAGYHFSQVFPCQLFSPRNHSAGYFFSENTHNPLKSQMIGR